MGEIVRGRPARIELLLACARRVLKDDDARRAADAASAVGDWDGWFDLAVAHGLLPLVHQHLRSGALALPEAVRARVDGAAAAGARRTLELSAELSALLRLCRDERMTVMPLKGPVLAQWLYGSVALRPAGDIDLLVADADFPKLFGLLTARGYEQIEPPPEVTTHISDLGNHVIGLRHRERRIWIEVHHAWLTPRGRRRWTLDVLLPRLQRIRWFDLDVLWPTAEDLFVYLCEHGAGHAWSRLEWLATVGEMLRRDRLLDDDRLRRAAIDFDATRRVGAAAGLTRDLIGGADGHSALVPDRWARRANRGVERRLYRRPERVIATRRARFAYELQTDPDASARLHRCWKTFVQPAPLDVPASFPAILRPVAFLLRPVGLLHRTFVDPKRRRR